MVLVDKTIGPLRLEHNLIIYEADYHVIYEADKVLPHSSTLSQDMAAEEGEACLHPNQDDNAVSALGSCASS